MLRITHVEMLPLETKQSGDKLLPHSDLRGVVFLEEVSRSRKWIFMKLEGVVGTGWSWLRIGTGGGLLWVR
jgi:hypothetical protein